MCHASHLHDGRHAVGHQPQVLSAHQHVGGAHQHGQRPQRVGAPQAVLALEEVVVVQAGQRVAPVGVQLPEAAALGEVEPAAPGAGGA